MASIHSLKDVRRESACDIGSGSANMFASISSATSVNGGNTAKSPHKDKDKKSNGAVKDIPSTGSESTHSRASAEVEKRPADNKEKERESKSKDKEKDKERDKLGPAHRKAHQHQQNSKALSRLQSGSLGSGTAAASTGSTTDPFASATSVGDYSSLPSREPSQILPPRQVSTLSSVGDDPMMGSFGFSGSTSTLLPRESSAIVDVEGNPFASNTAGDPGLLLGQEPNILSQLVYTPVEGHFQRLPQLLGEGSFGKVYQGINQETGCLIALKQISDVAAAIQHELDTMQSLEHPNIVKCLGMHQQLNEKSAMDVYLVMEHCAQGSLSSLQKKIGPLPFPLFVKVARQALEAMTYLAGRGLVHRDIKSGNMLMTEDGTVKLGDFGTARSFGTMTQTATVAGTLLYMAPEAGEGLLTPASDIWSLGITFAELITGEVPWAEFMVQGLNPMQIFFKIHALRLVPTLPPEVPQPLAELILRCCNWDPKERPSAEDLLGDPALNATYEFDKLPPSKYAKEMASMRSSKGRPARGSDDDDWAGDSVKTWIKKFGAFEAATGKGS
eukprot:TRINITY_DN66575_c5_g2_i1.p1 TRINITY_DN66575_c5_g2~~TRINITY_DN66575_c5_g2_i1.p1  ORF type:complete len:592 (-),score=40.92 TRINITY_DN66575_c5_g2_i1:36-1709(-)